MPYFIPDVAPAQLNPTVDRLSITDLVQASVELPSGQPWLNRAF